EPLRRGNGRVLVEDLHVAPLVTVPDEASRGGGVEGDAKPQPQSRSPQLSAPRHPMRTFRLLHPQHN
ncbi:unnamed protein product, partial [Boreogadus saida]